MPGRDAVPRRHYLSIKMAFTKEDPLTFIVPEPLLLRVEKLDRPGAPPGEQPVAFTRAGPTSALLAVNAFPKQLVDAFLASDAFGEPVIVIGSAWEEDGGVRGELSVLLSEPVMRSIQESASKDEREEPPVEAWKASAHLGGKTFEETVGETAEESDEPAEGERHFPIVIGAVLRFPENRKFPNDFELEVDDLMRSILEGRAMDASEKRIDNLLGGL